MHMDNKFNVFKVHHTQLTPSLVTKEDLRRNTTDYSLKELLLRKEQ